VASRASSTGSMDLTSRPRSSGQGINAGGWPTGRATGFGVRDGAGQPLAWRAAALWPRARMEVLMVANTHTLLQGHPLPGGPWIGYLRWLASLVTRPSTPRWLPLRVSGGGARPPGAMGALSRSQECWFETVDSGQARSTSDTLLREGQPMNPALPFLPAPSPVPSLGLGPRWQDALAEALPRLFYGVPARSALCAS